MGMCMLAAVASFAGQVHRLARKQANVLLLQLIPLVNACLVAAATLHLV
jgi:hypothetical protein